MFRYIKLLDRVANLALRVADLEARIAALEFRQSVGTDVKTEETDKALERENRRFAEGLSNLLAFDGKPQEGMSHGDE